ncbi:hypothetical protein Mgra_00004133 [Meloidogyne graminicola]|uniref:Uncharacterized protein n=1 Tax=Meloidogyne graminicola TaxID=189291 RepID=A0A8S9ZTG6_9BILA|nr:hypothetical protein Mgra_00004133 [Meloidogyne graminicola]
MKSSTAGLEKRKPSAKSMSSKSAPTKTSTANSHEMAPFFSIFYRGISSKINRSSRAKGNNVGDATLYRRATAPSNIKSRSTVELAKERALAEGKNWRENIEQTKSTINLNNSAPTSPQRQRRWPFNIKGTKTQSQELINSLEQNNRTSISSNSLIINNKQKELLPPIPIKRKQGQQQQQQKELPQSCEVFQSIPSSFIIQKSSNLPFQKISVENNFPPPSSFFFSTTFF